MCPECYAAENRITPLKNPAHCLKNHIQYICGTCGRCVCIQREEARGLQRWNFPFRSVWEARLYLRSADVTMGRACGIYEIKSGSGRVSYKIFAGEAELRAFLKKNGDKTCETMAPVFTAGPYREFPSASVRKLTEQEAARYLAEREKSQRAAANEAVL